MTTAQPPVVVIVGGGITGLSAAYYLLRTAREAAIPLRALVIERDERLGGKIRTDIIGQQRQFIIEGGPDAFLAQKPWASDLARDLGLGDELLPINVRKPATSVLVHGKPIPLPEGLRLITPAKWLPFLLSPVLSPWGKAHMLLDLALPARNVQGDESLAAFVRARLGDEALDRLAEPLMSGIYNGDPAEQSMLATFPQFRATERQYGSIIRGTRAMQKKAPANDSSNSSSNSPFLTLRGGMGTLVDALTAALDGNILSGRRVQRITPNAGQPAGYQVQLDDGTALDADAVILATQAFVAADLLSEWQPALAAKLRRIPYLSTGTMSLAFHPADIRRPFAGFGLVIPQSEHRHLNAITVTSEKFTHRAPEGDVLLRVFFGGFRNPDLVEKPDAELLALVRQELRSLMGITALPRFARIYRWRDASPQYHVGHLDLVREIERLAPPRLLLCGCAYGGVGIPDCVRQAKNAAARIFAQVRDTVMVSPAS
jgi:oxygen-dependent protoporphyrinogen oxidase